MTIGNPAFCLALHLTGVHFREELQYVGEVSEQKCKCRPIRTREMGGVRLSEALYIHHFLTPKNCIHEANICIFLYISFKKYLFQRRSKVLSGIGGSGGGGEVVGWGEAK